MNATAHMLGGLVGGVITIMLLSWLWSAFAFKRDVPFHRASKTVGAAVVTAVFGSFFGGGFDPYLQIPYVLAAAVVWPILYRSYKKRWTDEDDSPEVEIFR